MIEVLPYILLVLSLDPNADNQISLIHQEVTRDMASCEVTGDEFLMKASEPGNPLSETSLQYLCVQSPTMEDYEKLYEGQDRSQA